MEGDDPRLGPEYVRRLSSDATDGDVTLVGVVHDHPASVHRVETLTRELDPDVLALEIAPLALPLFERYAERDPSPLPRGGELSAAIRAADVDRIEPIDGPSLRYLGRFLGTLWRERAGMDAICESLSRFVDVSAHVIRCRIAATTADGTDGPRLDEPVDHDVGPSDDPATQSRDEHRQVRRATAVASAFESPRHSRLRDETREAHMASRLASLRRAGDVVAVVGVGHLDAIEGRLIGHEDEGPERDRSYA